MSNAAPTISIALPVYNGANYLAIAIESISNQTWSDFELILSDNASDDATAEICQAYAARDVRIRYFRNERNIGAAPNFNRAFERASGRYFKWMAHDDVLAPDFLAASLQTLQADPDAVLCYSAVEIINQDGGCLYISDSRLPGTEQARPSERFAAAIITPHLCFPVFGLIRTEVLRASSLLGPYDGSDRALVTELALCGRFAHVPRPLFQNRDHLARYIRAVRPRRSTASGWWAGPDERRTVLHLWALYGDYFRMVRRKVRDPLERLHCYRHLIRWLAIDWNALRLVVDLIAVIDPRVFTLARTVKQALFRRPDPAAGARQRALAAAQRAGHGPAAAEMPDANDGRAARHGNNGHLPGHWSGEQQHQLTKSAHEPAAARVWVDAKPLRHPRLDRARPEGGPERPSAATAAQRGARSSGSPSRPGAR